MYLGELEFVTVLLALSLVAWIGWRSALCRYRIHKNTSRARIRALREFLVLLSFFIASGLSLLLIVVLAALLRGWNVGQRIRFRSPDGKYVAAISESGSHALSRNTVGVTVHHLWNPIVSEVYGGEGDAVDVKIHWSDSEHLVIHYRDYGMEKGSGYESVCRPSVGPIQIVCEAERVRNQE
ncbi:hypothetical protein HDF17_001371 [Granulicella arctica]|uniref:Uncharacterized protein n=1 Tax=Granulicella arctica TaxID=940613 RepID=A0A7Y9PFT0_9BACT|nr:hypothetical protein [Granulicella arctica]